jgi:hypothetical protein
MAAGLAVQAWTAATASPFPLPPFHPGDARRILTALIAAGPEGVAFADYRRAPIAGSRR